MKDLTAKYCFKSTMLTSFFLASFLFIYNPCYANFKITLKLENCKLGLKCYLAQDLHALVIGNVIDSTLAGAKGVFILQGKVERPQRLQIFISDTKKTARSSPVIFLFVENSDITITANLNDIPKFNAWALADYPYPYLATDTVYAAINIKGSSSQTLFSKYCNKKSAFQINLAKAKRNYYKYLKSLDTNTNGSISTGIKLIRPIDSLNTVYREFLVSFIGQNKNSSVALLVAQRNVNIFSQKESKKILWGLTIGQPSSVEMNELAQNIENHNKNALGAKYPDYLLEDTLGKKVLLSQFIAEKKKYVLLEFWASWRGPCRKDIPHLKTAYNLYKTAGFEIVAISVDENKEKWKKAIKEDETSWQHLIDPKGFQSDDLLMSSYQISGIPASILISPNGEIVDLDMRESWLDRHLIELFGNRFGPLY